MVDANKSTELWWHPSVNNILPIRGEIYSGEWNISLIKIMFFYADDDNHVLEYTLHKSLTFFKLTVGWRRKSHFIFTIFQLNDQFNNKY